MNKEQFGSNPEIDTRAIEAFHERQVEGLFWARGEAIEALRLIDAPDEVREEVTAGAVSLSKRLNQMGPLQKRTCYIDQLVHFDGVLRSVTEAAGPHEHDVLTSIAESWYSVDELLYMTMQSLGAKHRELELVDFADWFHHVAQPQIQRINGSEASRQIVGITQQEGVYRSSLQWAAYARGAGLNYLKDKLHSDYREIEPGEFDGVVEGVRFATLSSLYEYVHTNGVSGNNIHTVERLAGRALSFTPSYIMLANDALTPPGA